MDSFIQEVFEIIVRNPGIDTPLVCTTLHSEINYPKDTFNAHLALWLMRNEREAWEKTCDAVDELLESGQITFGDDGELCATGYSA